MSSAGVRLARIVFALLAGCAVDNEDSDVIDEHEVGNSEETPAYGCWAYGSWSEIAYEGAGFVSASMDGEVKGQPLERTQRIQLRDGHPYSMESYTSSISGDVGATAWQWHARCRDDADHYGRWYPAPPAVYHATGCTTTYLRVRVRVAGCVDGSSRVP